MFRDHMVESSRLKVTAMELKKTIWTLNDSKYAL